MESSNNNQFVAIAVKTAICVCMPLVAVNTTLAANSAQELWQTAFEQQSNGNSKSCYTTLLALDHMIGGIAYDSLLGLCAQGAGYDDQALLAYNRIIAQQAQNAEIRLERARVLYNLNLLSKSRLEFNKLLVSNPPLAAREVINNYLSAIDKKTSKVKSYSRLKISTTLGHDDNVNSASSLNEFLGFTLNDNSKSTPSDYAGLSLSAEHQFKLSHNTGLKISASLGSKQFPDAEFVDQDLVTVGAGISKYFDTNTLNVDLLAYRQVVNSAFNSRGVLFRSSVNKEFSSAYSQSIYFKTGALRFTDSVAVKSVNQYSIGTASTINPTLLPNDTFTLDLSFGHDYPLFTDSNYEADFAAIKLSHSHKFNKKLKSRALVEYKKYSYDNPFFALSFPDDRTDDTLAAKLALDWTVNKQFKVSPNFVYRDNNSNVDLFSYGRRYAEINASYQWIW